jgi:protease I
MIKKVLFILMPQDFQDFEFQTPYKILNEQGFGVDVAGLQPGEAIGKNGSKFTPNLQLDAMTEKDFDAYSALVIPGGPGSTTYLWGNKKVQNAAWHFNDKKRIVATICNACAVPVEADLLKGKEATIYPSAEGKALFAQHGAKFVDQGCVINKEDNIITAQSPEFAKEFAQAIVSLLKELPHS